jgi:hypothetical protein
MPVQRLRENSRLTRVLLNSKEESERSNDAAEDERQTIVFKGNSEILKRCFTSVCDVRRTGSARFGFGVTGLSQFIPDTE